MNLVLSDDEADLLKLLLLAELEEKRVEMHHAKNMEFKAELQDREKRIQEMLKRFR
jgi:hypothetical protein